MSRVCTAGFADCGGSLEGRVPKREHKLAARGDKRDRAGENIGPIDAPG